MHECKNMLWSSWVGTCSLLQSLVAKQPHTGSCLENWNSLKAGTCISQTAVRFQCVQTIRLTGMKVKSLHQFSDSKVQHQRKQMSDIRRNIEIKFRTYLSIVKLLVESPVVFLKRPEIKMKVRRQCLQKNTATISISSFKLHWFMLRKKPKHGVPWEFPGQLQALKRNSKRIADGLKTMWFVCIRSEWCFCFFHCFDQFQEFKINVLVESLVVYLYPIWVVLFWLMNVKDWNSWISEKIAGFDSSMPMIEIHGFRK